jgi:hypothetical protein
LRQGVAVTAVGGVSSAALKVGLIVGLTGAGNVIGAPISGVNSEMNVVNYPSGGVNRPPTKACGVKTRRSKKSRQEVGENVGAALQNMPEARMQNLPDVEPQSSLGGVGTGGYGYSFIDRWEVWYQTVP